MVIVTLLSFARVFAGEKDILGDEVRVTYQSPLSEVKIRRRKPGSDPDENPDCPIDHRAADC